MDPHTCQTQDAQLTARPREIHRTPAGTRDDPGLPARNHRRLAAVDRASHRLRYQAYCLERRFLRAEDYPNQLEFDEFDRDSVHVGVLGAEGQLAGTARIVKPNSAGLPAFRHCSLFSADTTLADEGNKVVEISRVCINRRYTRRHAEGICEGSQAVESGDSRDVPSRRCVRHAGQSCLPCHQASGCDALADRDREAAPTPYGRYGLPFQLAGPEVDYYGRVAPYIMKVAEFDRVIIGRQFAALDDFPWGCPLGCGRSWTTQLAPLRTASERSFRTSVKHLSSSLKRAESIE